MPTTARRAPLLLTAALALTLAAGGLIGMTASAADGARTNSSTTPADAATLASYTDAIRGHVTALAQPFFEGRAPGTRGNALAAEYLEFELRRAGIAPAVPTEGGKPSFRQSFPFGSTQTLASQSASFTPAGAEPVTLTAGTDFNTLSFSASGSITAPVVFAGYAIANGENGYSSFNDTDDFAGKIVMLLRFEPMDAAGKSLWTNGAAGWSMRAGLEPKIQEVLRRNAAGVILVNPPGADDERITRLETIDSLRAQRPGTVPVVMMSIDAADRLVRAADESGRSLTDLRQLADAGRAVIDLPKAPASLAAQITREPIITDNVIGVLKGAGDLADQYLVIGAHYDHVGYGYFGSRDPNPRGKLHPGADDNASGTSAMLVLARRLADQYKALPEGQPRRSILFMGFTAEESGLNGSRHYVRNPIVPKDAHQLMINLDMVGRLREGRLEVGGVGTAEGLEDFLKPYFDSSGLTIAARRGGSGPSDHASFNAAQIPVLFFFTGLHDQYHKPEDTASTINFEGAAQVTDLVNRIALDAALRPEGFTYADTAGQLGAAEASPGPMRSRVRFGIAPGDYSGDKPGILVGDVSEGTTAAEAGLKPGDLMIRWNDKDLTTVESWMPLLAAASPGDVVQITYIRDGQEQTTKATLKARRQGE